MERQPELDGSAKSEKGMVLAICVGDSRQSTKKKVASTLAIEDFGIKDDIHAGVDHKQISMLSLSSLEKNRKEGYELNYGDLFENIVFQGLEDLFQYPIGTVIKIGTEVVLQITQIGKDHDVDIEVNGQKVRSIMPEEGIFTRVIKGGTINEGDTVEVIA